MTYPAIFLDKDCTLVDDIPYNVDPGKICLFTGAAEGLRVFDRLDLAHSWMIGDILNDVEAGHLAGCKSILIDNGNETEWIRSPIREPDHIAANLHDAALWIESQVKIGGMRILHESRLS